MNHLRTFTRHLLNLTLGSGLMFSLSALAATPPVALASSPLATSTTSTVQPNLMLMLDDSGSMDWDYMPDVVKGFKHKYGFNSSQCNGVAYDPTTPYDPPVDSAGNPYPPSKFIEAWDDGYDTAAGTTDLSGLTSGQGFRGGSGTGASGSSLSPQAAFYYTYTGSQTTTVQQDYFKTTGLFYRECDSAIGSSPGSGVFTKVTVTTDADKANFANWYSYYSTRMLMMKSGVGHAFKSMNNRFRVGFMSMNNNMGTDFVNPTSFDATQKSAWYGKLYGSNPGQSTPLRQALSQIGQLYANKFGNITTYKATITVGGSGSTSVTSVKVGTVELLAGGATTANSKTKTVAKNIAGSINASLTALYGASVSGSVVTITTNVAPVGTLTVVDDKGGMTFTNSVVAPTVTSTSTATTSAFANNVFTSSTVVQKLNGVAPNDPMQYSCQKNFVILSTDGYWNGNAGYKLDGTAIGNQDGIAPRPMYDGGLASKTTYQMREKKEQYTQNVVQMQKRTVQEQKLTSQLRQNVGTLQIQTSTLQTRARTGPPTNGTRSKVLMSCADRARSCGTAPTTGTSGSGTGCTDNNGNSVTCPTNWNVVTGSSGTCIVSNSSPRMQCQIVGGLSNSVAFVTSCIPEPTANITTGVTTTSNPSVTITVTAASGNVVIDRVRADGNNTTDISSGDTTSSDNNNGVASAIANNINACTSSTTGSCDISGHAASVNNNVITVTGSAITSSFLVRVKTGTGAGTATVNISYTAGVTGGATIYTLNNADSNGNIYSACTGGSFGTWTDATVACVPSATRECRYVTAPGSSTLGWSTVTNATSACTPAAQDNTNLTATQCGYATATGQATASCSTPALVANDYTNTTVYSNCATVVSPTWTNEACSTSNTTPDASGSSYQCRANDSGWLGAASCTASGPTAGLTVTCNPINTNGLVVSCTEATTACTAPFTADSCKDTSCSTLVTQSPTLVSYVCVESNSGSSGTPPFEQTLCEQTTPVVTANVSGCTSEAPSNLNNYTTTTCSGSGGGTSDTLADTAMYYYETDLRSSALNNCDGTPVNSLVNDVCENNVPTSGIDNNSSQHLTTFTLGLGARGRMAFSSDYLKDTSGDFYDVKKGTVSSSTICSWQNDGKACNWPTPGSGQPENIDDLWHAAIDGRGTYFNATNPTSLSVGLREALKSIDQKTGAAAAAATSTLNPTAADHFAYVASYTTSKWTGNLEQRQFIIDTKGTATTADDTVTAEVSKTADWAVEDIAPTTLCEAGHTKVPDTSGGSTRFFCSMPAIDANGDTVVDPADCSATDTFVNSTPPVCRVQIVNAKDGMLPKQVGPSAITTDPCYNLRDCDTRTIYTANDLGTALILFDAAYGAAHTTALDASKLSQWASLTGMTSTGVSQQTVAQANLVNYLHGRKNFEENRSANDDRDWLYRYREATFGDALESQPTFVAKPTFTYSDPGYSAFVAAKATRAGTVFIGANDGMLHAFNASTGAERWAYVPTMVIPNLYKLADKNYNHVNFINGSPVVSDICPNAPSTTCSASQWKTILVGGLNAGGRGYFALDVTDPATPVLLWEFKDDNLGYTYGKPVVAKKADGTWVVVISSGYDNGDDSPVTPALDPPTFEANSPTGDGKGHLFVLNANTGAIISDITTGVGTSAAPSGFAKFSIYNNIPGNDLSSGNLAGFVYGGDLAGNLWRFDINDTTTTAVTGTGKAELFATLKDPSGNTQPITVAPTLGLIKDQRVIFVGTGRYLEKADLANSQIQSIYAIKDDQPASGITNFPNPRNTLTEVNINTSGNSRTAAPATGTTINFATGRGWYADFPASKERVNIDSRLVQGTLIAPSIIPSDTICSPGGTGWVNYFDYETGLGGGLHYDTTIVGVNIIYDGAGNPSVLIVTNDDPTPVKTKEDIPFRETSASGFTRTREGWRELIP